MENLPAFVSFKQKQKQGYDKKSNRTWEKDDDVGTIAFNADGNASIQAFVELAKRIPQGQYAVCGGYDSADSSVDYEFFMGGKASISECKNGHVGFTQASKRECAEEIGLIPAHDYTPIKLPNNFTECSKKGADGQIRTLSFAFYYYDATDLIPNTEVGAESAAPDSTLRVVNFIVDTLPRLSSKVAEAHTWMDGGSGEIEVPYLALVRQDKLIQLLQDAERLQKQKKTDQQVFLHQKVDKIKTTHVRCEFDYFTQDPTASPISTTAHASSNAEKAGKRKSPLSTSAVKRLPAGSPRTFAERLLEKKAAKKQTAELDRQLEDDEDHEEGSKVTSEATGSGAMPASRKSSKKV